MEYIQVHLLDMPTTIRGLTIYNTDDSFTIFINAKLNSETQIKAYDHEMEHINNRDYDKMYSVDVLETLRHVG
ncbi:hypothetical protein [Aminipila sp.]|uniref:hypothetical protein n=1 Tax=Aminipila sp. TaxID=2060095 RepID=UPI00289B1B2C|nr:hypothetical protein [Aminipila sp.]